MNIQGLSHPYEPLTPSSVQEPEWFRASIVRWLIECWRVSEDFDPSRPAGDPAGEQRELSVLRGTLDERTSHQDNRASCRPRSSGRIGPNFQEEGRMREVE